jgi:hypothetical protein
MLLFSFLNLGGGIKIFLTKATKSINTAMPVYVNILETLRIFPLIMTQRSQSRITQLFLLKSNPGSFKNKHHPLNNH